LSCSPSRDVASTGPVRVNLNYGSASCPGWIIRCGLPVSEPLPVFPHSFLGAPLQGGRSLLGREYALVYRARLFNKTGPVELALRDKLYNFAHFAHHGRKIRRKSFVNDCRRQPQLVSALLRWKA
jgi:hypothetical protein